MDLLTEYFCLRTKDVARLIRDREPNENDLRSIRFTLTQLHAQGLITRLPYYDLETKGDTSVWGLNDASVKANEQEGITSKTLDEHSRRTLDHEIDISVFHMSLAAQCAKNGWTLYWQQTDLDCGIRPDAYFALILPKGTFHFFLEVERAKIGNVKDGEPSILRKLGNYYNYYNSDRCHTEWDFKQFRVIIIRPTAEKATNLVRLLKDNYDHRMFWITADHKTFATTKGDTLSFSDL